MMVLTGSVANPHKPCTHLLCNSVQGLIFHSVLLALSPPGTNISRIFHPERMAKVSIICNPWYMLHKQFLFLLYGYVHEK